MLEKAEVLAEEARAEVDGSPGGLVEAVSDLVGHGQSPVDRAEAAAGNLRLVQNLALAASLAADQAADEADRAFRAWQRAEKAAARVSVAKAARQAARTALALSQPGPKLLEADRGQRRTAGRALRSWQRYLRSLADADVVPPPATALTDPSRLVEPLTPVHDNRGRVVPGVARLARRDAPSVLVLPAETVRAVSQAFGMLGRRPEGVDAAGPAACAALTTAAYGVTDVDLPVDVGAQWQRSTPADAQHPQVGDLVFTQSGTGGVGGSAISLGADLVIALDPSSGVAEVRRLGSEEVYGARRATVPLADPSPQPTLAPTCSPEVPEDLEIGGSGWLVPLSGESYRLSSGFGSSGSRWSSGRHTGQDFATPVGTTVLAARAGTVTVERPWWAGTLVRVDHGGGVESWYAHLASAIVTTGDRVEAGDILGSSGNEGNSTGPHLHFEIRVDGHPVDPMPLLGSATAP